MSDEINYKITEVNLNKDEQFKPDFLKVNSYGKIPAIIDHDTSQCLFESSAILLYLANKYNRFLSDKYYWEILKWLMFQTSQVGPLLGQAHQFLYYNPGKSKFADAKYINYCKRIYTTLENRLFSRKYLVNEYSIADIATWPWIARYERHEIDIKEYPNVLKWYKNISKRPAVIKGYNPDGSKEKIPLS